MSSGECTSYVLRIAVKARSRALGPIHPSFNLVMYLRDGLYDFLPDNAHELASGRLFISLTRVSDRKNVLISQFDTKDDLIQVRVRTSDLVLGRERKKLLLFFIFRMSRWNTAGGKVGKSRKTVTKKYFFG